MSNTLTVFFNYTWSKVMDNNAFGSLVTAVVPGLSERAAVYEPNDKRLDSGPADYDHRNVISVFYVWSLPKMNEGKAVLRYIGGTVWQSNTASTTSPVGGTR